MTTTFESTVLEKSALTLKLKWTQWCFWGGYIVPIRAEQCQSNKVQTYLDCLSINLLLSPKPINLDMLW